MHHDQLFTASAAGLAVAAITTLPALSAIVSQIRSRAPKDNFYHDHDGVATPESIASFSNKASKFAVTFLAASTAALSIALAILNTTVPSHGSLFWSTWLTTAAWILILLQATCMCAHHNFIKVYDIGLGIFLGSLVNIIVGTVQANHVGQYQSLHSDITLILRICTLASAGLLAIASTLIPRRPDVFYNDEPVDRNFSVHALSRFTWGWGRKTLDLGGKKGDLKQTDVPRPPSYARSKNLVEAWESFKFGAGLLRNLIRVYGWRFAVQWTGTLFRVAVGMIPYIILLRLIQKLENTPRDEMKFADFWPHVVGLGLCGISEQWLDGYLNWYAIVGMGIPMSAQLSALVFEKSLRRKNVKTAEKNRDTDEDANKAGDDDAKKDDKDKHDKDGKDGKDETVLRSRQAIVNLVGVDSRRIADFLAMHFIIINAISKLILYSVFLIQLIGYQPYLAGVIAWAIVLPINMYASKIYLKQEDKLMKIRDEKLAMINEALLGIRQIKFSALEKEWSARIMAKRGKELGTIRYIFAIDLILFTCWIVSPILLAVVSLAVYAILNGSLKPSVAFVAIGIFKSLEMSLSVLPEFIGYGLDTLISIRRLGKYLEGPEMTDIITRGHDAALDNASIAWPVDDEVPEDERFVLRDLNLSFPQGELSVVSGKTGTGKSLLLSSLIGEVDLLAGRVIMPTVPALAERNDDKAHKGNWILPGTIAYVSQNPWLENATLRDNIIFGLPYDEERYNTVIEVCALRKDLDILEDGDQTELGANGINLSGGQKWRVTLARSVYSRAELLLLDDIFSAVDAHVGRQIFEKCIDGPICQGRTRILVTHHVALVESKTKYLVELGQGTVLHSGLTSDLAEDGTLSKIRSHTQTEAEIQADEAANAETMVNSEEASDAENELQKVPSKGAKKFVEDEKIEKGSVKHHVYATYINASGGLPFWIACGFFYIAYEAGNVGRNWWLQIWTGRNADTPGNNSTTSLHTFSSHGTASMFSLQHGSLHASAAPVHDNDQHLSFYLGIYAAIALASGIVGSLRMLWAFTMSLKASQKLFEQILFTVVRTPLRWLDTVPVGRVLNRMTADFDVIDTRLSFSISFFIGRCLAIVAVCAASTLVTPLVLPLALLLIISAAFIGKKYMDGARPMKRLESNSKSPVFELFNTTLSGVSTLRAFQKNKDYIKRMHYHLDTWNTNKVHFWIFNRWMGIRMAAIGTVFTTCVGIVIILTKANAAMAGFAMSFALDFANTILFAIRAYAGLELDMNAAERVVEYSELKMEQQGGVEPPAAWPTRGTIEMKDVVVGYAEGLPAVLKGVSFAVKNNERVGVIGRTGAGKSSMTLALFRFLEARSGSIIIDDVDISKIDLHSLRSRLAIIPQDPVLFSGTIRSNLDPFETYTDEELRECLQRVHLIDSQPATPANEPASSSNSTVAPQNTNIFRDLNSGISESGGNLSQGQRQLLCIARAIVSRPKIMVLDEATSAVDMATDALIQRSIREEFDNSTLLVIAHRLSTIADFDKILVLSEGTVAEYGSPRELWERDGSIFRDMCEHSGEKDKLEATIVGKK
ncbi:ABC bile acid transporter, putative [Cordyceps militaris CM01]|uniref:ABC bile acid transporter, putative n=1 Tax=Cordyceps militaris (strain CM01) TaxID=983644 RepID=G3JDQ2_CORMM|nr:ABC bile acid transporter, putative [Cordyceps militaris CM01]EGX92727.1 ABC bile acid transporter, putative [Cordyceps militaris CM01]